MRKVITLEISLESGLDLDGFDVDELAEPLDLLDGTVEGQRELRHWLVRVVPPEVLLELGEVEVGLDLVRVEPESVLLGGSLELDEESDGVFAAIRDEDVVIREPHQEVAIPEILPQEPEKLVLDVR